MKTLITILVVTFISLLLSTFLNITAGEFFISTIFTVSGIIFSVGLGLIVTFNMNGVKNKTIINKVRANLNTVRNSFISYFALTIAVYLFDKILIDSHNSITNISIWKINVNINWTITFCLLMLYSIMYFIVNFFQIQKLNEQIYDELNK